MMGKDKNKKNGYSIIEVLVAVALLAILTAIAVPNFSKMQHTNKFREEAQDIFDTISTARTNAISGKKCPDSIAIPKTSKEALNWSVKIDVPNMKYNLMCQHIDREEIIDSQNIEYSLVTSITFDISKPPESSGTLAQITFLPETSQSKISDGTTNRFDTKVLLKHTNSATQKSLCFNHVAGFPLLLEGNSLCP